MAIDAVPTNPSQKAFSGAPAQPSVPAQLPALVPSPAPTQPASSGQAAVPLSAEQAKRFEEAYLNKEHGIITHLARTGENRDIADEINRRSTHGFGDPLQSRQV